MELRPAEIAFRVGVAAFVLGLVAWLPVDLQWIVAGLLTIGSLIYFYETWVRRASRRAVRDNLVWAMLLLAGAVALVQGWAAYAATPLMALGGVCIGLWFAATLGHSDGAGESETEH